MYRCKVFANCSEDILELDVNFWLKSMKNTPMYDVQFHYAVKKGEYSVLITYRVEEEN